MTILPGHPIAPPDAPPPPAPPRAPRGGREPRAPRNGVGSRALVVVLAAVVALGGAGSWYAVHSAGAGGGKPAASSAPVVHHRAVHPASGKVPAPRTRAAAMQVATRILAVLPAQLPGFEVKGKTTFEMKDTTSDPMDRATAQCVAAATTPGIIVDSPDVFRRTATPTLMGVSAQLGFVRSPARAAADLAALGRPAIRQCIARASVGRTVSMGSGTTLRFTGVSPVRTPAHTVGIQFDGALSSSVVGDQAFREVMLFTVTGSTEIVVTSIGLGSALPLSTDLRVLNAIAAQTHRLVA